MSSAALLAYAQRAAGGTDADADTSAPLVGKRVLISGLLARPELNGLVGEPISYSSERSRYSVRIDGEIVALRSENLRLQPRDDAADATAFGAGVKVLLKGLLAKPELNGCGGTIVEWNAEKGRYVVQLDGSLASMLLRASNLERSKRAAWTPAMHDPATSAHIREEFERYAQEQVKSANPFAQMGLDEQTVQQVNQRSQQPAEEGWRE